jgi:hypothetical protein
MSEMLITLVQILFLVNRYVHIVCTTVLVGGTLFYETIVPVAIGDLKREQQLLVFGRVRWSFRGVVWTCAVLLVLSGALSSIRRWDDYTRREVPAAATTTAPAPGGASASPQPRPAMADVRRPGWWWAAHVSTGTIALAIALVFTSVRRPPDFGVQWMRLTLVVLLITIFLASTTRHMRLLKGETERERQEQQVHLPD